MNRNGEPPAYSSSQPNAFSAGRFYHDFHPNLSLTLSDNQQLFSRYGYPKMGFTFLALRFQLLSYPYPPQASEYLFGFQAQCSVLSPMGSTAKSVRSQ